MLCRGPLDTVAVSLPATRLVYVSVLVRIIATGLPRGNFDTGGDIAPGRL